MNKMEMWPMQISLSRLFGDGLEAAAVAQYSRFWNRASSALNDKPVASHGSLQDAT